MYIIPDLTNTTKQNTSHNCFYNNCSRKCFCVENKTQQKILNNSFLSFTSSMDCFFPPFDIVQKFTWTFFSPLFFDIYVFFLFFHRTHTHAHMYTLAPCYKCSWLGKFFLFFSSLPLGYVLLTFVSRPQNTLYSRYF